MVPPPEHKPLISVVIPTFNRVDTLYRSICSVNRQTYRNVELIVVDDGSTDATSDLLASISKSIEFHFVEQPHRGVSAARNKGIAISRGNLIAFLDSDDEWREDKLEKQLQWFDPEDENFICHSDELWLKNGRIVNQKNIHKKQGGFFFERALERCLISPSAALISRSLLDKVGHFDEALPAAEDYDLWLRVTAFYPVKFVNEPLITKYGDRSDQLSKTIPAIDKYRI
ncbi:MAG: glycosyltransferase, partial [Desulfomonilaceae bacterium]